MKTLRWTFSYLFMSMAAISLALYLTSAVMSRSHAQNPKPLDSSAVPVQPSVNPNASVPEKLLDESAPIEQSAISTTSDDFVFDPTGLRDPFKPYKAVKPPDKNGLREKNVSDSFDPLQNLDIDALELVAVLWDVKNPRALVKTKGGNTYTIKRDSKIGRNNGIVAGIREGEVIILEVTEEDGRPFKQYKTIKMATAISKINKSVQ